MASSTSCASTAAGTGWRSTNEVKISILSNPIMKNIAAADTTKQGKNEPPHREVEEAAGPAQHRYFPAVRCRM